MDAFSCVTLLRLFVKTSSYKKRPSPPAAAASVLLALTMSSGWSRESQDGRGSRKKYTWEREAVHIIFLDLQNEMKIWTLPVEMNGQKKWERKKELAGNEVPKGRGEDFLWRLVAVGRALFSGPAFETRPQHAIISKSEPKWCKNVVV